MNKGQLVEKIVKDAGVTKAAANTMINTLVNTVKVAVKKNEPVKIVGFGTFKKGIRKARKGRNPQTGETIKIKRKTFMKFVASKTAATK